jgi:hypothetical protein
MPNAKIGFARVTDGVRGWHSERWLVLVIVVLGAAVLYAAFSSGQKVRAIAEDRLWRAIADEDRAFCEKFGMHAETPQFVTCGQELWIIRQRQADRDGAAAQGLL